MDLWDTIKALRRQCPMVDLLFMAVLAKGCVCLLFPRLAPALQHLLTVPLPVLRSEPIRAEGSHRQQNMRVRVVAIGVVDGYVSNHAVRNELALCVLADKLFHLIRGQFTR